VDGAAYHHTRRAFHEDRSRDRSLATLWIQVLRVTWTDLQRPAAVAREIADVYAARCAPT
jgi:very-short-patch-repair endonuclease